MQKTNLKAVVAALAVSFSSCGHRSTHELTKAQEEAVMKMAVDAQGTPMLDYEFGSNNRVDAVARWDCVIAITRKHNQMYPKSTWPENGLHNNTKLGDETLGKLDERRTVLANACAEQAIREATDIMNLNTAFQKR